MIRLTSFGTITLDRLFSSGVATLQRQLDGYFSNSFTKLERQLAGPFSGGFANLERHLEQMFPLDRAQNPRGQRRSIPPAATRTKGRLRRGR